MNAPVTAPTSCPEAERPPRPPAELTRELLAGLSAALLAAVRALIVVVAGLGLLIGLLSVLATTASAAGFNAALIVPQGDGEVLELLRLRVPAAQRTCWRQAEASTWEHWLAQQQGYRGRQLFWDPEREEGVLLIRWARQSDWDAIPTRSLEEVQTRFEAEAQRCLAVENAAGENAAGNPFPLVFSGALLPEPSGPTRR